MKDMVDKSLKKYTKSISKTFFWIFSDRRLPRIDDVELRDFFEVAEVASKEREVMNKCCCRNNGVGHFEAIHFTSG
jgi:hypothetical protein